MYHIFWFIMRSLWSDFGGENVMSHNKWVESRIWGQVVMEIRMSIWGNYKVHGRRQYRDQEEYESFHPHKTIVPNFIRNWLVVDAIFVKAALWWKISEQHCLRGTDIGEYWIWNQLLYLSVFLGSIGKGHRTLLGCTGRNL